MGILSTFAVTRSAGFRGVSFGLVAIAAWASIAVSCSGNGDGDGATDRRLLIVTSTALIADLAREVAGDRAVVETIIPATGDPHSYEPSPSDAGRVSKADVVLLNGLLLETRSVQQLVHNNSQAGTPVISLGESVEPAGGVLIPLEEDLGLEVLWLGLAVLGESDDPNASVLLRATDLAGPGNLLVFVTDVFGAPRILLDSRDRFATASSIELAPGAHTHVNWAFTAPGDYRLTVNAQLRHGDGRIDTVAGNSSLAFHVGDGRATGPNPVSKGHADVAVDLAAKRIVVNVDGVGHEDPAAVTLVANDLALEEVPADPQFDFLGGTGSSVWMLPQAVLGTHVHGEVDPHLWHTPDNARAYVRLISEVLSALQPEDAGVFSANAEQYIKRIDEAEQYMKKKVEEIAPEDRRLVTTHDAYGYLAYSFGLRVTGFVVPNPGQEPSAAQVNRLTQAIASLSVPAVFVEPNLASRADVLRQVARDQGVQVCQLYSDSFDNKVSTYLQLMQHNADELARCLKR